MTATDNIAPLQAKLLLRELEDARKTSRVILPPLLDRLENFLTEASKPAVDNDVDTIIEICQEQIVQLGRSGLPKQQVDADIDQLNDIINTITRLRRSRDFWKKQSIATAYSANPTTSQKV